MGGKDIKRPVGLPRMGPSRVKVALPPPPPPSKEQEADRKEHEQTQRRKAARAQRRAEIEEEEEIAAEAEAEAAGLSPSPPRRNKAVKQSASSSGARAAASSSMLDASSSAYKEPQWGAIDDTDGPVLDVSRSRAGGTVTPPPPLNDISGSAAGGKATNTPAKPPSRYEKKYVKGSITIVGCTGLINHTTTNTIVQTNPFVEVYDNNPKFTGSNGRSAAAAEDANSAGGGATNIVDKAGPPPPPQDDGVRPILLTPHMKNTVDPTFDYESATVNFRILLTGHLTVQARHHEINKTFRANGLRSSAGIPNNKIRSVSTTRTGSGSGGGANANGKVSFDKYTDLDTFLGEVNISGAEIAGWLAAAGAPSPVRRINEEGEEEEEAFTVHHANATSAAFKPLKTSMATASARRNKAIAGSANPLGAGYNDASSSNQLLSQQGMSKSMASFGFSENTHTVTIPLAPRRKEENTAVKAAFAKNELGAITIVLGPCVEGFDYDPEMAAGANGALAAKGKGAGKPSRSQMKGFKHIPDDEKVDGYLKVIGGENLLKRDVGEKALSDPYVIVYYPSIEDPVYRSDTADCTLHPKFKVCEEIPIDRDNEHAMIIIDAWNDNPRPERDNFLGRVMMRAADLPMADNGALKVPLAPREKERDSDISKLAGRLGSLILSWRVKYTNANANASSGNGAPAMSAADAATLPSSSAAAVYGSNGPRPSTNNRPSARVPSAPPTSARRRPSEAFDNSGVDVITEDIYIAPPMRAAKQRGPSAAAGGNTTGGGRIAYHNSLPDAPSSPSGGGAIDAAAGPSAAVGGGGDGRTSPVAPLDPAAIHSMMSTLNTSGAGINLQALLNGSVLEKPVELPKHRSMFFTAEDYARRGVVVAAPPLANGASPYVDPSVYATTTPMTTTARPSTAVAGGEYYYHPQASGRVGGPPAAPASPSAPYGYGYDAPQTRGGFAGCSLHPSTAHDNCAECHAYRNTAMPPADQIHPPPPFGSVMGETRTTAPIIMTSIMPVKLTDDRGVEVFVEQGIDDPNLKALLAAAERCFNIHPSSAMLLHNGEMLNPMLSLRENGVLMLRGDGAVQIMVKMFKGQRVNVVVKVKKGPLGSTSNPNTAEAQYYQQQREAYEPSGTLNYCTSTFKGCNSNPHSAYVYIPLAIDSEWTVKELKHALAAHSKCPPQCRDPNNFHFYWRYNRLVDSATLYYYKIPNGTELEVQPKQSKVLKAIADERLDREYEEQQQQQYDYGVGGGGRFTDHRREEGSANGFYEEDLIGIPRHKTALELRRERRQHKGSVTDVPANSDAQQSIRNRAKAKEANNRDRSKVANSAPITTVTRKGGVSNRHTTAHYGGSGGAAFNPLTASLAKMGGGGAVAGPIEPLGAPEYAMGRDVEREEREALRVDEEARRRGAAGTGTLPRSARGGRGGPDEGLGTWGSATYSDAYANFERPEWDDRRSTAYNPNGRFPSSASRVRAHSGYGLTKSVLGGRATASSRPASPSAQQQQSSSRPNSPYNHRHLNENERYEAMDIRPSDWRQTLRTDGRRNMHVRMQRDMDDDYHRGGSGTNDGDYTFSYSIRPLPHRQDPNDPDPLTTAAAKRKAAQNANGGPTSNRPMSPQQQAKARADSGELIYGETSDAPRPIYGNDYAALEDYQRQLRAYNGSASAAGHHHQRGVVGGGAAAARPSSPMSRADDAPYIRPASPYRGGVGLLHTSGPSSPSAPLGYGRVGDVSMGGGGGYDMPPRPPTVLLQPSDKEVARSGRIGVGAGMYCDDDRYDADIRALRDRAEGVQYNMTTAMGAVPPPGGGAMVAPPTPSAYVPSAAVAPTYYPSGGAPSPMYGGDGFTNGRIAAL